MASLNRIEEISTNHGYSPLTNLRRCGRSAEIRMELIAFASGKGGTGKTLMAACLGYALIRAGQRVLMIDADPATDGLSLFLLGREGMRQVEGFEELNTFTGALRQFQKLGTTSCDNRDNVTLLDVRAVPIEEITPRRASRPAGAEYEVDAVVFATGFDAMTGTLFGMGITGRDGLKLEDGARCAGHLPLVLQLPARVMPMPNRCRFVRIWTKRSRRPRLLAPAEYAARGVS